MGPANTVSHYSGAIAIGTILLLSGVTVASSLQPLSVGAGWKGPGEDITEQQSLFEWPQQQEQDEEAVKFVTGAHRLFTCIAAVLLSSVLGVDRSIIMGSMGVVSGYGCMFLSSVRGWAPACGAIGWTLVSQSSGWIFATMLIRNLRESDAAMGLLAELRSQLTGAPCQRRQEASFVLGAAAAGELSVESSQSMLEGLLEQDPSPSQGWVTKPWVMMLAHPCSFSSFVR